jgi:hypothetical protein
MGARNHVGIGLSYRSTSLCSFTTQFQTRFLESIPRPIAGLKFSTLFPRSAGGGERGKGVPSRRGDGQYSGNKINIKNPIKVSFVVSTTQAVSFVVFAFFRYLFMNL